MPIERWDPFRDMERLAEDIDYWWPMRRRTGKESPWAPDMDIKETDNEIMLKADLPGMKMEDINVSIEEGRLNISGERKMEKEEKGKDFVRVERAYGSFSRSFTLGIPVKEDEVKASYRDGVLEVTIPKVEPKKPKKITVEAGK
jgi:HSP20 family protein